MLSPIRRLHAAQIDAVAADAAPHAREASPVPVLPAPGFVAGDPLTMIAKLLVKSAQQSREAKDLSTRAEEQAEDAADARRIAAMDDKAQKTMMAGMLAGASQFASGAGSLSGGIFHVSTKNEKLATGGLKTGEGAGNLAGGLAKLGEAGARSSADAADRDVARAESQAKLAKRAQDALHKEIDAATQHQGKVIQLLQEIKQAQAQCERAALLRMA